MAGWETASSSPWRSVIAPRRAGTTSVCSCGTAAADFRELALTTPSQAALVTARPSPKRKRAKTSPTRRSIRRIGSLPRGRDGAGRLRRRGGRGRGGRRRRGRGRGGRGGRRRGGGRG